MTTHNDDLRACHNRITTPAAKWLLRCSAALALLGLPGDAGAQGPSTPLDTGWLSAAIEDVQRSPFHATQSALSLGMGTYSGGWSTHMPSSDSTFAKGGVFFAALGAAALSDLVGVYLLVCSGGGSGCAKAGGFHGLAAITIPVLGTATGAALAGARFLPALTGSAAGLGVVVAMLFADIVVDPNDSFLLFITIPALVQAGMTTQIASAFN